MRPDTYVALAILAGLVIYWIWQSLRLRRRKRAIILAWQQSDLGYDIASMAKALQQDLRRRKANEHVVDTVVEQTLSEENP